MSEELNNSQHSNEREDGQLNPPEQKPQGKYAHLSPDEFLKLKSAQKRNMFLAIVVGVILATMGYIAGQNVKGGNDEPDSLGHSYVVAVEQVS